MSSLFDEVIAASRLTPLIAPFTITRLLVRADVVPRELTRDDLARALPTLEEGLRVYLDEDELAEALTELRALAGEGSGAA